MDKKELTPAWTEQQIYAMAWILCVRVSKSCGIPPDDEWEEGGNHYIDNVRAMEIGLTS